jgi:hypothetical protein
LCRRPDFIGAEDRARSARSSHCRRQQALHGVFGRGLQVAVAGDLDALQVRIGDRRRAELRRFDFEQSLRGKVARICATICARRRRLASGALGCQAGSRHQGAAGGAPPGAVAVRRLGGRGLSPRTAGRAVRAARLDARDILARARVALDDLALVDEQRHLDRGAGGQAGRLGAAGAVSPRTPGSVSVISSSTKFGGLTASGAPLYSVTVQVSCSRARVPRRRRCAARLVLLEVLRFHEMEELAVVVEVLHVAVNDIGPFERVAGLEGLFPDAVGLQVAQLDAVEGLALAGFDEFVLEDGAGVTLQHDFQARFEFVGRIGRHCISS